MGKVAKNGRKFKDIALLSCCLLPIYEKWQKSLKMDEKTRIFHGLKIVFLESTIHNLSTNDLLVHQKTVLEDIQSRLLQVHNRKRRES